MMSGISIFSTLIPYQQSYLCGIIRYRWHLLSVQNAASTNASPGSVGQWSEKVSGMRQFLIKPKIPLCLSIFAGTHD